MDKVVDHLLVFKGQGEVQDFPGNYTQYREWAALESDHSSSVRNSKTSVNANKSYRHDDRRRMSFKEKREFEQLEREIATLEDEQRQLEEQLCSGQLSVEELTEKSKRLPLLKDELDAKSMRWLELSEIES
jgi:ATP-binding cassette subfamily F protein uup